MSIFRAVRVGAGVVVGGGVAVLLGQYSSAAYLGRRVTHMADQTGMSERDFRALLDGLRALPPAASATGAERDASAAAAAARLAPLVRLADDARRMNAMSPLEYVRSPAYRCARRCCHHVAAHPPPPSLT